MTVDDALRKTSAALDELIDDARHAAEDTLRRRGATEEEVAIELKRFGQEAAALRLKALAMTRAFWETGSGIIQ
jgi:hypothetical protein